MKTVNLNDPSAIAINGAAAESYRCTLSANASVSVAEVDGRLVRLFVYASAEVSLTGLGSFQWGDAGPPAMPIDAGDFLVLEFTGSDSALSIFGRVFLRGQNPE